VPPLHDVLTALAGRPEVTGALVVSDEGLVIDSVLPTGLEAETVAAMGATALRAIAGLSESLGHGAPASVVIEGPTGTAVLGRLPSGAALVVVAADDGDLGELLYDLRRHTPALSELV
jgi:predicted regulator of Ras-like GTPase activity (Roadblock/LC7/MglB family)